MKWWHVFSAILAALLTWTGILYGLAMWWIKKPLGPPLDIDTLLTLGNYEWFWAILFGVIGAAFFALFWWIGWNINRAVEYLLSKQD